MDQIVNTPTHALNFLREKMKLKEKYENFIGGEWIAPAEGRYFDNVSPIDGNIINQFARSSAADIEKALDAAHKAKDTWAKTSSCRPCSCSLKNRRSNGSSSR